LFFRKQFVIVDNSPSNEVKVISGVPQGSALGPLLFLIYINDLPLGIDSQIRLFADDALLFIVRKNKNHPQQDLNTVEKWSHTWQMCFNAAKCSVISVGEKNSHIINTLNNTRLSNENHIHI